MQPILPPGQKTIGSFFRATISRDELAANLAERSAAMKNRELLIAVPDVTPGLTGFAARVRNAPRALSQKAALRSQVLITSLLEDLSSAGDSLETDSQGASVGASRTSGTPVGRFPWTNFHRQLACSVYRRRNANGKGWSSVVEFLKIQFGSARMHKCSIAPPCWLTVPYWCCPVSSLGQT